MKKHRDPVKSLALIGMLAVCMTVFAVCLFLNTASPLTMKDDGFQISAGRKDVLKKGTKLTVEEAGTTFRGAAEQQFLNTSPIYYENAGEIILPYDMVYVNARETIFLKAERFQTLSMQGSDVLYERQRLKDHGFLFDGKNTYVFLEKTVLKINGKTQTIGPLSCIMLYTSNTYTLYDTDSKSIQAEQIYQEHVEALTGDYRVDLVNDILYGEQDEKTLLFDRSDLLEPLKGE